MKSLVFLVRKSIDFIFNLGSAPQPLRWGGYVPQPLVWGTIVLFMSFASGLYAQGNGGMLVLPQVVVDTDPNAENNDVITGIARIDVKVGSNCMVVDKISWGSGTASNSMRRIGLPGKKSLMVEITFNTINFALSIALLQPSPVENLVIEEAIVMDFGEQDVDRHFIKIMPGNYLVFSSRDDFGFIDVTKFQEIESTSTIAFYASE